MTCGMRCTLTTYLFQVPDAGKRIHVSTRRAGDSAGKRLHEDTSDDAVVEKSARLNPVAGEPEAPPKAKKLTKAQRAKAGQKTEMKVCVRTYVLMPSCVLTRGNVVG